MILFVLYACFCFDGDPDPGLIGYRPFLPDPDTDPEFSSRIRILQFINPCI
jgi:hypothetical protein